MEVKDVAMDLAEITVKTALDAIPVGGALIGTVWDVVKGKCLSKRNEEWKAILEKRLSKLENTLDDIGNNELFTTALIKSTELAMKTSKKEKMEFLANAVIHSVNPNVDEEKLIVFLNLLDKYSVSHIKILYFFYEPTRFDGIDSNAYMAGSPTTPLFSIYPEMDTPIFDKIYNDLYVDGLVNTEKLRTMMTGKGMVAKRTTQLGDEFLFYILGKNLNECDAIIKKGNANA